MTTLTFAGKRALVTGASRGIGQAIAQMLLDLGGSVIITSRGRSPDWARAESRATHIRMDFQEDASVESLVRDAEQDGPVDILVNNAGVHAPQAVDAITTESWERVFRVNVYGPTRLVTHFAGRMKERRAGRIVNIASIAGTVCRPNAAAYASSKLALIGLTRASAVDLAPFGVLVNAVSPGTTQTDMVDQLLNDEMKQAFLSRIPMRRFATPSEIATVAVFLASELNTYITGQNIFVDGGTSIA